MSRRVLARDSRTGFTLVELLVVILIIGLLASMLTGAVMLAQKKAQDLKCKNNLKEIGSMCLLYADAHNGAYPFVRGDQPAYVHFQELLNYYAADVKAEMLNCPFDGAIPAERDEEEGYTLTEDNNSYAYADRRLKSGQTGASKRPLASDDYDGREESQRHSNGMMMVVYADAQVDTVEAKDIPEAGILKGLVSDEGNDSK